MERSENHLDYDSDLEIENEPPPKKQKLAYEKAPKDKRRWKPIELVNVVVTGSTQCSLDLHKLSKNLLNAEYFPKKFAALKLCRTNPFAKALVFRSGKIVCVGATSIERAIESLEWFAERIKSVEGNHISIHEQTIQNMVASTSLLDDKVSVNLQKVFDNCPENVQFEP
jgi:transcription initiation factor TFIID TATA-box-binding protein